MFARALLTFCLLGICVSAGAQSPAGFSNETSGPVRLLGEPCLSFNVLGGLVTKDPKTGNDLAVMTNMNERGGELILVDLETNTGEKLDAPSGQGGWALKELPGNRIAYGTFYDGHIMVFDLKTREWIKDIDVPGEQYVWNFTIGADGRLYGGTYDGGKLVSMDTETYEIKDHGNGAPPNLYGRYVSALPDGRILVSYTSEMPTVMLFDPKSEKYTTAPEAMRKIKDGVCWKNLFVTADKAFDSATLNEVEWPFTVTTGQGETTASANILISTSGTLYLTKDKDTYRMRDTDTSPTLISSAQFLGNRAIGATDDGRLVGIRGQEFFVSVPEEGVVVMEPMPAKPKPRPPLFLAADNEGNVWGGPEFGQNVFIMNAATGETTNTQIVTHRGGEVYDIDFKDGIAYMVSYVGGQVIRYDPREQWNQVGLVNPKPIVSLDKLGYIRPAASCTFGPDGRLYSGWWADYGKYGGAIAITEVPSGETRLIENPLGEQGITGLDVDDKFAYVATGTHGNGMPVMKKAPQFGMVELDSGKVVFQYEFTDYEAEFTSQSTPLIVEEMTGRVALSKDGKAVKIFDPKAKAFVLEAETVNAPGATSFVMASMHNGKVLYGAKRDVVELDVTTGRHRVVATLPEDIFGITADPGGAAYAGAGTKVYEISLPPEGEDRE